ncbi:MAG: signal peptide peptidase SppA [Alphaproteobacteria bacterium]
MTHESDILVDRRRLKRGIVLWRVLAVVALVAVVVAVFARFDDLALRDHVARLSVEGLIVADRAVIEALADVADDPRARALIVRVDSPGGTFVGGESLYRALRRVAEQKPVIAVMGTVATSAGYMTAIAADRVFAHEGTITGSIGVMLQTTDITGLLDKLGVSAEAIKSTPLKATPSPLEPLTDEARAAAKAIIDDMHALFTAMVAERRSLDAERARKLADGRVYSGRQALQYDLVDAIGGETEARAWLAETKGISERLPVRDVEAERPGEEWLPDIDSLTGKMFFSERLILDGLVSVWHPDRR